MSPNSEKQTLCLQCGTPMTTDRGSRDYEWSGIPVLLADVEVRTCPECGEEEISIESVEALHRAIAMYLADKEERLTPREIRFLRKWLGLSNVDFARRMGVTQETTSRWQREDSPMQMDVPVERLLRLMVKRGQPDTDYDLDGLEHMATKKAGALKLKALSSVSRGWQVEAV